MEQTGSGSLNSSSSFDGKMPGLAIELREFVEGSRSKRKHHLKLIKWLRKKKASQKENEMLHLPTQNEDEGLQSWRFS